VLLAGLRAARGLINKAIKKDTPDPWAIDYEAANVSTVCLIPGLHGSCICTGSVGYNVTLDTLSGVSNLVIESFDSLHAVAKNLSFYTLSIEASLNDQSMGASGSAAGSIGACGLTPTLRGHASADGNATGTVSMTAQGRVVKKATDNSHCMQIDITAMDIPALAVGLDDIKVDIDLGDLHIPISYFVSLFQGPLTRLLREKLIEDLPEYLPEDINPEIPCIPFI
jgi:hypothetical protein